MASLLSLAVPTEYSPHASQHCCAIAKRRDPMLPIPSSDPAALTLESWQPMRGRKRPTWVLGSSPRTRMATPSAWLWPWRHPMIVVLPAPFGPSSSKISPRLSLEVDVDDGGLTPLRLAQMLHVDDGFDAHERRGSSVGGRCCIWAVDVLLNGS